MKEVISDKININKNNDQDKENLKKDKISKNLNQTSENL